MSTDEKDLLEARGLAEELAALEHAAANRRGSVRPLPWQPGYNPGDWTDGAKTWRDDERVNITPTHVEIQIYRWADSPNEATRKLEADNEANRPPDCLRLRRMFTVADILATVDYPTKTEFEGRIALASVLSADTEDELNRVEMLMLKRASAPDWWIVDEAIQDIMRGKD